jgi:hypothetical protein
MKSTQFLSCGVGSFALALFLSSPLLIHGDDLDSKQPESLQALARPITVNQLERPLQEVVADFRRQTGAKILFRGLPTSADGTGTRIRVNAQFQSVALDKALSSLLPRYGLDWTISNGVIAISTREQIWSRLNVRTYPIDDLLGPRGERQGPGQARTGLVERIKRSVTPQEWRDVGGRASIVVSGNSLIIKHTARSQNAIARLLAELRSNDQHSWPAFGQMAQRQGAEVSRLERLLGRLVHLDFRGKPLRQVVEELDKLIPISIKIDRQALKDEGLAIEQPVDLRCDGVSFRAALMQLLGRWDLSYVNRPDSILITTLEEAESQLETQSYPVAELARLPGEEQQDLDAIAELVITTIDPVSWEDVGGTATIKTLPSGSLIVAQTAENHVQLRNLLDRCFELRRRQQEDPQLHEPMELAPDGRREFLGKMLDRKIDRLQAVDMPLTSFAEKVHKQTGLLLLIDTRALDDVGIGTDVPVSIDVRNVSLGSALRTVLRDFELTLLIRDEVVWITSPEESEAYLATKLYPVRDLVTLDGHLPAKFAHLVSDELLELVTTTIAPESWADVGGPGSIELVANQWALAVAQTDDVHARLTQQMQRIRRARKFARTWDGEGPVSPIALEEPDTEENAKRIRAALASKVDLQFHKKPLAEVAKELSVKHGIAVVVDTRALDDVGIGTDSPITFASSGTSLESALRHMMRPYELAILVQNESLWLTTPEEEESQLVTLVYPVPDLVLHDFGRPSKTDSERDPEVDRLLKVDFDSLIDLLTSVLARDDWDNVGGPGAVEGLALASSLVVSQTTRIQSRVGQLIEVLRADLRAAKDAAKDPAQTKPRLVGTARETALWRVLHQPVRGAPAGQSTVRELADKLTSALGATLFVDTRAMDDVGLSADARTIYPGPAVPLGDALDQALKPSRLTWTIRDDAIVITTPEEAEREPLVFLYSVRHRLSSPDADSEALRAAIVRKYSPKSWEDSGGIGVIRYWEKSQSFVITQTPQVHRQLARELASDP